MTPRKFEDTLDRLREEKLPKCPGNLEQNVLRKIRLREQESPKGFIVWIHDHLFDLGWGTPVMACAIILASIASSAAIASSVDSSEIAAMALGFDSIVNIDELAIARHW